jgi:hypothetical protein
MKPAPPAALDPAHVGDIEGAFGFLTVTVVTEFIGVSRTFSYFGLSSLA